MPVVWQPGDELGRGDLDIFLTNASGNPANAYEITYSLYYVDPAPPETEVLIPPADRTPVNPAVGEYYAAIMIPPGAIPGTYRIRWTFREFSNTPPQTVVQEWAVVEDCAVLTPGYSQCETDFIWSLRVLLRDQNPDKFYHFRPPEYEGDINQYNQVFGQIWEDAELLEYLERALDWWNMYPPETEDLNCLDKLCTNKPVWKTAILWGAIVHATFALSMNWIADEFDYSCGGISLSIEKSSKYESMKQNAETQFEKAAGEVKVRTTKFIRGLKQSRYGPGIRSSFGPYVGRGVLSPRGFIS